MIVGGPSLIEQAKNPVPDDGFLQIVAKPGRKRRAKAKAEPKLTRVAFRVSRLMEFCTKRELQNQTGHSTDQWPLVVFKELMDNALDACEEAEIPPVISVAVTPASFTILDNGAGIKPSTVKSILDYNLRVSSREAYVSPTRGAQGNALKTILAMGYVLDRERRNSHAEAVGVTIIETKGVRHHIKFEVDHINNQPRITHTTAPSTIDAGTRITVRWPKTQTYCGETLLTGCRDEIEALAETYVWFNPHLTLRGTWGGKQFIHVTATNPGWDKWRPRDPTSAHWYDEGRLQRYLAAHVARDRDLKRQRTVREFISEFRGLSGSAVQRKVLEEVGCSHVSLAAFFGVEKVNRAGIARLLASMRKHTRPVAPKHLGIIGEDHLKRLFVGSGGIAETFEYKQRKGFDKDGLPYAVEFAFGLHHSGLTASGAVSRKIMTGANWSAAISNPFRSFGATGEGLEAPWRRCAPTPASRSSAPCTWRTHASNSPTAASPRSSSPTTGSSQMTKRPRNVANDIIDAIESATSKWTRQKKSEERHRGMVRYRASRMTKEPKTKQKEAAWQVMEDAYMAASNGGRLPAMARQIYYQARPKIMAITDNKQLAYGYFSQKLLPDYIEEKGVSWNVVYDARGHFEEPHTNISIGCGTIGVRNYIRAMRGPDIVEADLKAGHVRTIGLRGNVAAVLFCEKEGFGPLFKAVDLANRYDLMIISTKGVSVTAARQLVETICGPDIPLFALHDFDVAGFMIFGTLSRDTRRYKFSSFVNPISLGLRLDDIDGLEREPAAATKTDESQLRAQLRENGATDEEIAILIEDRVELNALTSDALIEMIETKLRAHGLTKVVPSAELLADTYVAFHKSQELEDAFAKLQEDMTDEDDVEVPEDLEDQVRKLLDKHPHLRWDDAVRLTFDETKLEEIEAKKTKSKEEAGDFSGSRPQDDDD